MGKASLFLETNSIVIKTVSCQRGLLGSSRHDTRYIRRAGTQGQVITSRSAWSAISPQILLQSI